MAYISRRTLGDAPAQTSPSPTIQPSRSQRRQLKPLDTDSISNNNGVTQSRKGSSPSISRPPSLLESKFPLAMRPRTRAGIVEDSLVNHQQNPSDPSLSPRNDTASSGPSICARDQSPEQTFPRDVSQLEQPQSMQTRILIKRSSPTSSTFPVGYNDTESEKSPKFPLTFKDGDKIKALMKKLGGRMRGVVEYRINDNDLTCGLCFIDNVKGSLMCKKKDGEPFLATVVVDLRGIQIEPVESTTENIKWLQLSCRSAESKVYFKPIDPVEFDLWLAALLCWQQVRAPPSPNRTSPSPKEHSKFQRSTPSSKSSGLNVGNIIKVAELLFWDNVTTSKMSSPLTKVSKTLGQSTHPHLNSSWRQVSCILHDNGVFKLLTEDKNSFISIINLSQFSRCSIQMLDESVLNQEYCIGIFPQYSSVSNQNSVSRPLYIALDSRLSHEVWFCLLRAFTTPHIYGTRLAEVDTDRNQLGELKFQTPLENMFRVEKSMKLRVIEAKIQKLNSKPKLPPSGKSAKEGSDTSGENYFAEVILNGEIRARTSTRNATINPSWREDCELRYLPSHPLKLKIALKQQKEIVNSIQGASSSSNNHINNFTPETAYGTTEITLNHLDPGMDSETWWPVLDHRHEKIGEVLLGIKYEELVVLLINDYQPISKLLHNFGNGLTIQISQALSSNLKALSETMINIFEVSGHAGEWLTTLVEEEIDGPEKDLSNESRIIWSKGADSEESVFSVATVSDREQSVRDMGKSLQVEANLLFRGNSLLTQALDFHMRRVGKEYLAEVLTDQISEINSLNPDCEVDPSKITNAQDRNKNWALLFTLTTNVWKSICDSVSIFPSELRKVLKYIRAVAEDRYGDFMRKIAYTSVSGILFLRFFCPALLNPKLFGLLRENPQAKAQRTLTLIAKGLQALANFSNFRKKEEWMEPMNRFLAVHKKGMKAFIDSICAISSQDNTSSFPASYTTPVIILGRLPPIHKEGFLSLPYLIDHAQNFSKLVKLWLDARDKITPPHALHGELLEFHQLCLELRQHANECLRKAEQIDQASGQRLQGNYHKVIATTIRDESLDPLNQPKSEDTQQTNFSISPNGSNYASPKSFQSINGSNGTRIPPYDQERSVSRSFKPRQNEQSSVNSNSSSAINDPNYNSGPLSGSSATSQRRGRENVTLPYMETHESFMSATWAGGFV